MTKHYSDNKEIYFEIAESVDYKGKYQVDVYSKMGDRYMFERSLPEDKYFNDLPTASSVAEILALSFNWGVETIEYTLREQLVKKITDAIYMK